ncbi:MAG: hypothetical protein HKN21_11325 [Candidatus Eisenbacteria bacterium]|uniref:DUF3617 family protein n=1 Tax=Eiseniibacteriota bacterium TaxID=2212470 RepID=A0A7Y2H315_UNCEI|nr:hypothetical protein [Candidatus Eisenbacteria bacterium]
MKSLLLVAIVVCLIPTRLEAQETLPKPTLSQALSLLQEDFFVPQAWAGVWEIDELVVTCNGDSTLEMFTELDTLCTNSLIEVGDDEFSFTCKGTVSDTQVSIVCTFVEQIFLGCTQDLSWELNATRNGETYVAVGTVSAKYAGPSCGELQDSCVEATTNGTRVGPEPNSCEGVPVEPTGWGTIKVRYGSDQ